MSASTTLERYRWVVLQQIAARAERGDQADAIGEWLMEELTQTRFEIGLANEWLTRIGLGLGGEVTLPKAVELLVTHLNDREAEIVALRDLLTGALASTSLANIHAALTTGLSTVALRKAGRLKEPV